MSEEELSQNIKTLVEKLNNAIQEAGDEKLKAEFDIFEIQSIDESFSRPRITVNVFKEI